MKETVAKLYACIVNFIVHATRWYKQGKLAHAWAAVAKPWALSFKTHFEDIASQAQQIEALARSASRAELRDAHLEIRETRSELQKARDQMQSLERSLKFETRQLIEIAMVSQSVHAQIQIDLSESKTMIANIQLGQILDMSFAANLPASGECLGFCQSMAKRRRSRTRLLLPNTAQLQRWSDHPRSSFLITESSSGQAAKDFLVEIVDLIRASDRRILWALRFADYWERNLSVADILRMLAIQALQINPKALTSNAHPITMSHLREAVDERDWLMILNRAIAGLPFVYIVLDADLLGHATGRDRYLATKLIEAFPRIVNSTVVKVVVSTAGVDERYASSNWDPECWSKLRTDHVDVRQSTRRRRRRPKDRIMQNRCGVSRKWSR
jgi:Tfp pilus assembly protein PilO